jgi:hypothetical protein
MGGVQQSDTSAHFVVREQHAQMHAGLVRRYSSSELNLTTKDSSANGPAASLAGTASAHMRTAHKL